MGDTVGVSNDQGWALPGFGFPESPYGVGHVGTHRNLSHIYVAVRHGHHAEVLLAGRLTSRRKLRHSRARGRLGCLSAGVGVHGGVQHQHVHIQARSQNMVQTAVTNVVRPAITTDNPDALLHQVVSHREELLATRAAILFKDCLELLNADALIFDAFLIGHLRFTDGYQQVALAGHRFNGVVQQFERVLGELVNGQAHAHTELCIIFKQGVRPGRTTTIIARRIRRSRQVPAINGGATGRVGNDHAVAKELRGQLDVRGFTTACAGAGEFEHRGQQLRALHRVAVEEVRRRVRNTHEVIEVLSFAFAQRHLVRHVDSLLVGLYAINLGKRRAGLNTQMAAGAVFGCNLNRVLHASEVAPASIRRLEGRRGLAIRIFGIVDLGADRGVRAHERALVALNAGLCIPYRDFRGDVTLFVLGRPYRERTISRHRRNGEHVATPGNDFASNFTHKFRCIGGNRFSHLNRAAGLRWNGHLSDAFLGQRSRADVHVHNRLALQAIGILNGKLNHAFGFVFRQYARNLEVSGLHRGIDTPTQTERLGNAQRINDVELGLLGDQGFLDSLRQPVPDLVCAKGAVQQERSPLLQRVEHFVTLKEAELMASQEVGFADQVGAADRILAETQVRDRARTGFLRVIHEVTLRVVFGCLADDLNRVLVTAYRAIGTEAPEHRSVNTGGLAAPVVVPFQAGVGHIVNDTNREVVARLGSYQIVKDRLNHAGIEFFGTETITPANYQRRIGQLAILDGFINGSAYIKVQRFARGAGFLGAVQHSDLLDRLGQHSNECFACERAIQADLDDTNLLTFFHQFVNGFVGRFGTGSHQHHDVLSIRRAFIVK